jgi:predicted N-acetyltransferase YhbS
MPIVIEPEQPQDAEAIDALLDGAFGPDRSKKQSYRYRQDVAPLALLCLVAREGDRLLGTIRYWPVVIVGERRATPALLLGPIGVAADRRRERIGDRLMRQTLLQACELGHRLVLLVGDLGYYGRFGFRPAAPYGIGMPGEQPERLQLLELASGALAGVSGDLWPARQPGLGRRPSAKRGAAARAPALKNPRYGT